MVNIVKYINKEKHINFNKFYKKQKLIKILKNIISNRTNYIFKGLYFFFFKKQFSCLIISIKTIVKFVS